MHFPEKDKIFSELDKILPKAVKIVVGVSGGPDSAFTFALLEEYYQQKGWDHELLIVAHFHHGQRKESDKEQKHIFSYYQHHHIYYNKEKPIKGMKETAMRTERQAFFAEICETEKTPYLALGHNLDDRIETSLLNLLRGASLQGLSNMKFYDYKKGQHILRPLIDLQKSTIQSLCDIYKIHYFTDATNADSLYTKRNALRNIIIPQLTALLPQGKDKWYESWITIYRQLEQTNNTISDDHISIISLNTHHLWQSTFCYQITLIQSLYSASDRIFIFQQLGIYKNVSQKTLAEWVRFSNTCKDGYKQLAGVYFFFSHGKIYAINGAPLFREKQSDEQIIIADIDSPIIIDRLHITPKSQWKGALLRYAREGDSYKGKRLKKRMINEKIPMIRRNFVPVVEKKGVIIDVIKEIVPALYMQLN